MTKYKARKTTTTLLDGSEHTFDSIKEASRYKILAEMQEQGRIEELQIQVPFVLIPSQRRDDGKAERPCKYIADFVYTQDGTTIVEDTKGFRTADYIIKRKLMLERYGISIREI